MQRFRGGWIGAVVLVSLLIGTGSAHGMGRQSVPTGVIVASDETGQSRVSSRWLRGLLREEVIRATGWEPEMVEIRNVDPSVDPPLPDRPAYYEVRSPARVSAGQKTQIGVVLQDEHGQIVKRIWVSGWVDLYRVIWALNRPLRTGEILERADTSSQRRDVRQIPPGALEDPREVLGMQARRSLNAGTVLQRDQWSGVPLVRKGQRVRIVLDTASLRLMAQGESLEAGSSGEPVRVLNLGSRKVVIARVRDRRTVQVDF